MKKPIVLIVIVLGSMISFAGNANITRLEKKVDQVLRKYYRIEVHEWYYPGGGVFPTTSVIYTVKGWYTEAELDARKIELKAQYPDNYTNGTGSRFLIFSYDSPIGI